MERSSKIFFGDVVATIVPGQDYDMIHTLTFAAGSGTCKIRLYRGSSSEYSGTVYYRSGTSGEWTQLAVSGTGTTFPVSDTTMQVGHDHNKSGNDYMTVSFYGQAANLTGITISQKAVFSGTMGNYFMALYANGCSSVTSLDIPDTSGLTGTGSHFLYVYAGSCPSITSLGVPDTSGLTGSAGNDFMAYYANECWDLQSLIAPDTSGFTSAGDNFMLCFCNNCYDLTSLTAPDTGNMTSAGIYFVAHYTGSTSLVSLDAPDTSNLITVGHHFLYAFSNNNGSITSLGIPDTSSLTSTGTYFMNYYADVNNSLLRLELPAAGWFVGHDISWYVPSGRLGYLKGYVKNSTDLTAWRALTASGKTLYINYIRSESDVLLDQVVPWSLFFGVVGGDI